MKTMIPEDENVGTMSFRDLQKYAKRLRKAMHLLAEELKAEEASCSEYRAALERARVERDEAIMRLEAAGAADRRMDVVFHPEVRELVSHTASHLGADDDAAVAAILSSAAFRARSVGKDSVAYQARRGANIIMKAGYKS